MLPKTTFTLTEGRVADLMCRGLTTKEIASQLGVSFNTVRCHIRGCYQKSGATNRVEFLQVRTLADSQEALEESLKLIGNGLVRKLVREEVHAMLRSGELPSPQHQHLTNSKIRSV